MDKLLTYVGGVLAGYALTSMPVEGTFLSSVEPILDGVGMLSMIVFSGMLIYGGVKALIGK
ncbi:hypothetical protein [Paenibacillus sp. GYB003]|uniref:hypothetical protein n=1 Tax=Paenibacillus sp. GYB003 TaxID=2994392 RepID=UPI002F965ECD